MLNTLMKYEWKFYWKKMLLLVAVTVVATIIGVAAMSAVELVGMDNAVGIAGTIIGFLAYYGILISVSFGCMILIGVHFYKSTYGDESYITHTLPVTARQILVSKTAMAVAAIMIISITIFFSMLMVMNTVMKASEGYQSMDGFTSATGLTDLYKMMGMTPVGFGLFIVFMLIVSSFANVSSVCCAVVLGQTWKKHKILGAVVWYVIISLLITVIASICTMPVVTMSIAQEMAGTEITEAAVVGMERNVLMTATVVTGIIGIITYIISDYGLTKKLNLE